MRRSLLTVRTVLLWAALGLWAERSVGASGQLVLGVLTVGVLAALLAVHDATTRIQTLLVVAVASSAEVVGSLLWGLYTYRLENLPTFVPPGHGLVFLGGMGIAHPVYAGVFFVVAALELYGTALGTWSGQAPYRVWGSRRAIRRAAWRAATCCSTWPPHVDSARVAPPSEPVSPSRHERAGVRSRVVTSTPAP